jgi:hypothetical protein
MFFNKKEPIDIRDIPRPKVNFGKAFVAKDGYGFVDLTKKRKLPSEIAKEKVLMKTIGQAAPSTSSSPSSSFSFFDTPSTPSYPSQSSSTENSDTSDLMRKISSQISDLDSKLYKMEQRIELLERKAGVGDSSSSSGFAW